MKEWFISDYLFLADSFLVAFGGVYLRGAGLKGIEGSWLICRQNETALSYATRCELLRVYFGDFRLFYMTEWHQPSYFSSGKKDDGEDTNASDDSAGVVEIYVYLSPWITRRSSVSTAIRIRLIKRLNIAQCVVSYRLRYLSASFLFDTLHLSRTQFVARLARTSDTMYLIPFRSSSTRGQRYQWRSSWSMN